MAEVVKRRTISAAERARIMDNVDWKRVEGMSELDVEVARLSDPDALHPLSDELIDVSKLITALRKKLDLTQAAFASAYRIPLGTLRDWEQGKTKPDAAAWAYLRVIEKEPAAVARALAAA